MGFAVTGRLDSAQLCLPEEDAVVIITSETGDMQGRLNLVWEPLASGDEALAPWLPIGQPVGRTP